jgi:hypothetical protein
MAPIVECSHIDHNSQLILKIYNLNNSRLVDTQTKVKKEALNIILYYGISIGDNCPKIPPYLSTAKEQIRFKKIEKEFFSKNGDWKKFVHIKSLPENNNNDKNFYQISIDKNNLRTYLEEQKIIKSLTNGF